MNCPRQNVSVTEEVNHRDGFYKVGCTLISISLRWGPDPKQTPTTPLILNIIYFINPFKRTKHVLTVVTKARSIRVVILLFLPGHINKIFVSKSQALLHFVTKTNILNCLLIQTILLMLCYALSTQLFLKNKAFFHNDL